ncbi:MAG: hypothetical protein EA361_06640 [Bacteroidetes bacterium]|nr:MAG: hypothetical protein EA361_06640 [Bacteroidota bacterium]
MNDLLSGLHLYEIVLLLLGIFLFVILSVGLMYYIIKKEKIKQLFLFYIFPIVMIGYPSIMEITVSKDRITLKKKQEELLNSPHDQELAEEVQELTEKLEGRSFTAEQRANISKSWLLLGDNNRSTLFADKALEKDENHQTAQSLKQLAIVMEEEPPNEQAMMALAPGVTHRVLTKEEEIKEISLPKEHKELQSFLIQRLRERPD